MNVRRITRFCGWFLCFCVCALAQADERILAYRSDIQIDSDGAMTVTETIRVRAEGVNIRRGLYREFPTQYSDRLGNVYLVGFRVVGLTRDGRSEPWDAYPDRNGMRVDFGSDEFLRVPAEYEYALTYRTNRQLGFFADHDELYWNVTGNGWTFAIDEASAAVRLPVHVPRADLAMEGYTGAAQATGQNYTVALADRQGTIRTTVSLRPREGLTLVFSWPKGIVTQPTRAQEAGYVLRDNRSVLVAALTLIAAFAWLFSAWRKVGRDPEAGVIFPHYDPPEGCSPGAARYVSRFGYDSEALTAALINLAVQGYVHITNDKKKYLLTRRPSTLPLSADEQELLEALFGERQALLLDNVNHAVVSAAQSAHARVLKQANKGRYFLNNTGYVLPSLMGTIVMILLAGGLGLVPLAVFMFIGIVIMHIVFGFLLRAPTKEGRQLLDMLEGFKLYLDVAEKDEMNLRNPPQLTPELFERYLPFAVALGVEQAWAKRFERALASLQGADANMAYHPIWYTGHFNPGRMHDFTRDVGNGFNSAISSASMAPGSSSGSGGGGFSGGGGGGGGGGGR